MNFDSLAAALAVKFNMMGTSHSNIHNLSSEVHTVIKNIGRQIHLIKNSFKY